jgi:putative membrane protein insertion efficiency factor
VIRPMDILGSRPRSLLRTILSVALALVLFGALPDKVHGQAPEEPLSQAFEAQSIGHGRAPGPVKILLEVLLLAYQRGVSPVDGPSCPFHPTCSQYARQSLRKRGVAEGILMTGDRLMRCNGTGQERYPRSGPNGSLSDPPVFETTPAP